MLGNFSKKYVSSLCREQNVNRTIPMYFIYIYIYCIINYLSKFFLYTTVNFCPQTIRNSMCHCRGCQFVYRLLEIGMCVTVVDANLLTTDMHIAFQYNTAYYNSIKQ